MTRIQLRWIDERSSRLSLRNSPWFEKKMRRFQMMKRSIRLLHDLKRSLSSSSDLIRIDTRRTRNTIRMLVRILTID